MKMRMFLACFLVFAPIFVVAWISPARAGDRIVIAINSRKASDKVSFNSLLGSKLSRVNEWLNADAPFSGPTFDNLRRLYEPNDNAVVTREMLASWVNDEIKAISISERT
ncbi:uncharacterized protein MELLADRAFT_123525 [Melampsora larici-populina 98AG31]|uniref:Secreted protein n=1 Tax=Melampsora larici-populina (strain 98AG31 / pathotype 3-4-7) TaxID=747676 RepID=F4RS07_MELLP|nr:uncharacterized protein MELLADRAFT_123525 [Melampsora larici-populina 98AG31]EGG04862.1 secreted protein [Melampsora larici-populina 98AG31]